MDISLDQLSQSPAVGRDKPAFVQTVLSAIGRRQTRWDWGLRLFGLAVPTLFLAAVIMQPWEDPKWMFLDPLTAAQLSNDCCHTHYGFVSLLGVMLWVATAAAGLFTAIVLFLTSNRSAEFRFALTSGILTGWLALDDAFLLHETVGPAFGIPQNGLLGLYATLALAYVASSWRVILSYDFWLLGFAGSCLVVSLGVDVGFHSLDPMLVLVEDSAKFMGIFAWAVFHISTLVRILLTSQQGSREGFAQ